MKSSRAAWLSASLANSCALALFLLSLATCGGTRSPPTYAVDVQEILSVPDSSLFLVNVRDGGDEWLATVDPATSVVKRILKPGYRIDKICASAKAANIVFAGSTVSGEESGLFLLRSGTESPQCVVTLNEWEEAPTISRDGRILVYAAPGYGKGYDLWLRDLQDEASKRLTETDTQEEGPHLLDKQTLLFWRATEHEAESLYPWPWHAYVPILMSLESGTERVGIDKGVSRWSVYGTRVCNYAAYFQGPPPEEGIVRLTAKSEQGELRAVVERVTRRNVSLFDIHGGKLVDIELAEAEHGLFHVLSGHLPVLIVEELDSGRLKRYKFDSEREQNILAPSIDRTFTDPTLSNEGNWVAFISGALHGVDSARRSDMFVCRLDGSKLKKVDFSVLLDGGE